MSLITLVEHDPSAAGRRLAGVFSRWTLWYFLGLLVLGLLGVEAIYGHPTPFYDLLRPAFLVTDIPFFAVAAMLIVRGLVRRHLFPEAPRRIVRSVLTGVFTFILIALALIAAYGRAHDEKTTFYAALGADWPLLRWHLLAIAIFTLAVVALVHALRGLNWFDSDLSRRATRGILAALVAFSFVFPATIAMLRDGPKGITTAYSRYTYEYISDIGKGGSFHGLFRDYIKLHRYLSMHAKVHPPGPIILLWFLSFFVGQEAMNLSIATIAVGALGIIPLYYWARDLTNPRAALTCCFVYATIPSIVLFTATSADILFTPFTFLTLLCFGRALERRSIRYALAAGVLYALLSLTSFSLISLGGYFGLTGLWKLGNKETRGAVLQTAILMLMAFLIVQFAVYLWSGFNIIDCFRACQNQFNRDQLELDQVTPRYPSWTWKFLNPLCWLYFAGIPVSVLFFARLRYPQTNTRTLFIIFALTLVILDVLYLARGEGERSAMYVFPFMALPAAHLLDQLGARIKSFGPLAATLGFLAFQCWLTESYFYTYW